MSSSRTGSRRGLLAISLLAFVGVAALAGLGSWQLQRLSWKEALTERIHERLRMTPVAFADALETRSAGGDVDYLRVRLVGIYDHGKTRNFHALLKGRYGRRLLTPMRTIEGRSILVDRGFVPDGRKPTVGTTDDGPSRPVAVTGVLRLDYMSKGAFSPDNETDANRWYWFDLVALRRATGLDRLSPMVVQLDAPDHSGAWPQASPLSPDLPNRHFGYALTWFGLAIALLAVYIAFAMQERRKRTAT